MKRLMLLYECKYEITITNNNPNCALMSQRKINDVVNGFSTTPQPHRLSIILERGHEFSMLIKMKKKKNLTLEKNVALEHKQ